MILHIVLCCYIVFVNAFKDDYFEKEYFDDKPVKYGMCNKRAVLGGWMYSASAGTCNQFYHCDEDGTSYLQSCAAGTFYDGSECQHAEKVHCPYDPCQRKPNGYRLSDGQSCYGYFICIDGRSKYLTCPNGFYYNSYKKSCHPDPTCLRDNLRHPCSFGTTYPSPGKPNQFYLYDGHSTLTTMKCPDGLWYRPEICSCDWVIPGKIRSQSCSPMFHFSYNGNFLERNNRVQQVPNSNVAIYRKSALFNKGGKIIIWSMNNIDLDNDFSLCFEFMVKTYKGEVALISNDLNGYGATYKITYTPGLRLVRAYIVQKNKRLIKLRVFGVNPVGVHFVRLARSDEKLTLRVNNMPPAIADCGLNIKEERFILPCHNKPEYVENDGIAKNGSPMVIGKASGCHDFEGFIDEVKFYKCVPKGFFDEYDDDFKGHRHNQDDSDEH